MDQQTITSQLRQLFPSQPGADKDLFRGKKDQITDMQPNQMVLVTAVIWPDKPQTNNSDSAVRFRALRTQPDPPSGLHDERNRDWDSY